MKNVVSIDPKGARDLDDAVAATALPDGGWRVEILLPDVPTLVPAGSHDDLVARRQGVTVYAADAIRRPMLPMDVVERLSLSPDEDRPVVRVEIALTPDLRPSVTTLRADRGRTAAALTYDEADAALTDADHPHHARLAALWDLARRLHEDRAAGTGATHDLEARTFTDEEGRIRRLDDAHAHRSNMIVMEMMVLANVALAAHAEATGAPVIYRNHRLDGFARGDRASASAELALREGIGPRAAQGRLRRLAHAVGPADLGTSPLGHHGLDLARYGWFTSPLRRYVDLVNLRSLVHGVADREPDALAARLTAIHRVQREASADHHGAASRRDIARAVGAGRVAAVGGIALHVVMRALSENPGFDAARAWNVVAARMAADRLSGRDVAALDEHAAILGPEAPGAVRAWIDAEPARGLLLAEHRGQVVDDAPCAPADDAVNHKGLLLERAAASGATVSFDAAARSGPSHAPVFRVTAVWRRGQATVRGEGTGRTLRAAERSAAADALGRLAETEPASTPTPITHAKSQLLEMASRRCAQVRFDTAQTGPGHAPRFDAVAVWNGEADERRASGTGATRKEAEKAAAAALLAAIDDG